MSRQAEIVRQGFESFNSEEDAGSWLDFWAENVVLHELPEIPDRDLYRGLGGIREWRENIRTVLGDFRFELRTIEERDVFVLAGARARGTGAGAGVPVEWEPWIVFRFRSERVAEAWGFLDEGQARDQARIPGPGGGVG